MGDLDEIKSILEAALLVAGEPLSAAQLAKLFDPPLEQDVIRRLLEEMRSAWAARSVELTQVASGLEHAPVDPIEERVERQDHERDVAVDHPEDHARGPTVEPGARIGTDGFNHQLVAVPVSA